MFLSKLVLNPRDSKARRDLGSPYEMHRTLWKSFPTLRRNPQTSENLDRVLFRVDADPTGRMAPVVLVQSNIEPAWSELPDGYLGRDVECKTFDPQFQAGQRLRFRLRANPTKKHRVLSGRPAKGNPGCNGRRLGLFHESEQIGWLLRDVPGKPRGFKVEGQWLKGVDPETGKEIFDEATGKPKLFPNFRVVAMPEGRVRVEKGGTEAWLLAVRFEGVLKVTDADQFRQTIASGIGSAKGFGFGLLSVAPA